MNTPRTLSAPELQRWLEQGSPLQLVDVREEQELQLARLRDGAFAAAGLDYAGELAGWLGPETGLWVLADQGGQ
ncbi:MAG: sulfurtransferase, partial [Cyanobium sp.]